ncbi:peptidoglycan-binding domain-containing protein [Kitasatospora sp. NPDC005856]|uniref:peptidoglycan-binding domain-containing protein n=1 Tax=Kitasatospora sp. NPDC005856 TaxID=3154566 RepID=UPI0033EE1A68
MSMPSNGVFGALKGRTGLTARTTVAAVLAAGVLAGIGVASAESVRPGAHGASRDTAAADVRLNLREGMRGDAVSALQRRLDAHGHRVAVDGVFGPETTAAVKAFQRAHGLKADGIVGPATWTGLLSAGRG